MKTLLFCLLAASATMSPAQSVVPATPSLVSGMDAKHLGKGSKIFIEPMDGFETYLAAAILKKNVPVIIVDAKEKADFILSGVAHTEKAGWAKTIFISGAASAGASIALKEAHTGDLAYAYSVDKYNSARGSQSTAEACAKHLKQAIDKK